MVWEGPNPPTEPAGYDPDNKYADPVLYLKHREAKVAEEYVKVAEAKVRPGRGGRWRRHTATAATARLLQPGATALLFTAPLPHLPCATLQLIRKKLKKCYKEAGVNYQQDCRELAHVRHEACCRCPPLPLPSGAGRVTCLLPRTSNQPLLTCRRCFQEYLSAIKGVGVYRANSGPHDEPRWEAYGAGKPSQ
jgi:hypothetical protein